MKTYNCCRGSKQNNDEIKAKKSENNLAQVLEKNRADLENSAGYEKNKSVVISSSVYSLTLAKLK